MPSPEATKPAYLIWNPREKKQLLPYDAQEAIRLNQQRGDLGTMFESEEDLKTFDEGTIRRNELRMKHGSNIELMRATRNDMARGTPSADAHRVSAVKEGETSRPLLSTRGGAYARRRKRSWRLERAGRARFRGFDNAGPVDDARRAQGKGKEWSGLGLSAS